MGRAAAAVALAALVVVLGAGVGTAPARAASAGDGGPTAEGTVPLEVQAAFDGEVLRRLVSAAGGGGGQVRAGTVHQVFHFTREFQEGGAAADPVEPAQEWIAGYEVDGVPAGWQRFFSGGPGGVASAGTNPDPVGAEAFLSSSAGALVEVPWDGDFFTLVDGVVTPLETQSWDAGLGPRSLAQVQADFATDRAETAAAYACCEPSDGCAGGALGREGSAGAVGSGGSTPSCGSTLPGTGVLAFAAATVALAAGVCWTSLQQARRRRRAAAALPS